MIAAADQAGCRIGTRLGRLGWLRSRYLVIFGMSFPKADLFKSRGETCDVLRHSGEERDNLTKRQFEASGDQWSDVCSG